MCRKYGITSTRVAPRATTPASVSGKCGGSRDMKQYSTIGKPCRSFRIAATRSMSPPAFSTRLPWPSRITAGSFAPA